MEEAKKKTPYGNKARPICPLRTTPDLAAGQWTDVHIKLTHFCMEQAYIFAHGTHAQIDLSGKSRCARRYLTIA